MTKLDLPPITDEEEAQIQAGIAADPDNPEITAEQWEQARPFAEVFPEMAEALRRTRGPLCSSISPPRAGLPPSTPWKKPA